MPVDEAVLDLSEGLEPVETDLGEELDGGEGVDDQQEQLETLERTPAAEVEGDERLIPQWLRDLKTTDPVRFKQAKGLFFGKRAYDEKFPEGMKQVEALQSFMEEHGGQEGLATALGELKGQAEELTGLMGDVASGNPRAIDRFVEASPEGFTKLAPVVMDRWAKADPDGYGRMEARVIDSALQGYKIPLYLERIELYMEAGKTAEAAAMIAKLKGWSGQFGQMAAAAPKLGEGSRQPANKLDERERAINQREAQGFETDLGAKADTGRLTDIAKELGSFIAKAPKDVDKKSLAIDTVRLKVLQKMSADTDFQGKLNGLTARRDREGALRLIRSREALAIKEIAPGVGRSIYGSTAVKATAVKTAAVKTASATQHVGAKKPNKFDEIWNEA